MAKEISDLRKSSSLTKAFTCGSVPEQVCTLSFRVDPSSDQCAAHNTTEGAWIPQRTVWRRKSKIAFYTLLLDDAR